MQRTEIEKMRRGESPDFQSPELQASFRHAKELLARMRTMSTYSDGFRELLEQLIPGIPPDVRHLSALPLRPRPRHPPRPRRLHQCRLHLPRRRMDPHRRPHPRRPRRTDLHAPPPTELSRAPHGPRACAPRHHRRRLLDRRRSDYLPRRHDRRSHRDWCRQRRDARHPRRIARRRQSLPRHPPIRGRRGRYSLPITHHNGP